MGCGASNAAAPTGGPNATEGKPSPPAALADAPAAPAGSGPAASAPDPAATAPTISAPEPAAAAAPVEEVPPAPLTPEPIPAPAAEPPTAAVPIDNEGANTVPTTAAIDDRDGADSPEALDFSDEAAEQFEQELAATKIAAIHRGKTDRARVAALRAEKARQAAEEAEQALAATKIAAIQRGKTDRARVQQLKEAKAAADAEQALAATKIAAIQRGKQDRARVAELREVKNAEAAAAEAQAAAEAAAAEEAAAAQEAAAAAAAAEAAAAEVAAAEAEAAAAAQAAAAEVAAAEAEAAAAAQAAAAAAEAGAAEAAAAAAAEAARAEEAAAAEQQLRAAANVKPPSVPAGSVDWTQVFDVAVPEPSSAAAAVEDVPALSAEMVDAAAAGDCSKLGSLLEAAGIAIYTAKASADEQERLRYMWPRPTVVPGPLDAREEGSGRTALHHAAMFGSKEAIELLVRAGADVNAVDDAGNTPLWANVNSRAGWSNNPAGFVGGGSVCSKALAADALLTLGADPNASGWSTNEDGTRLKTAPPIFLALMFESDNDQPEFPDWTAVALLLRHCVDLTVGDSEGVVPLEYAEKLAEGSILAPSVKLIAEAEAKQIEITRTCAATQRLALARVTEHLASLGLHTGPGAFWHDRIIDQLKYRPVNGGPEKGVGSVVVGAEYTALEKQPITEEAAPRSKQLAELPAGSVVLATGAEFTKMRTRVKIKVVSTPEGKPLRNECEEGWIGIGIYTRREARRLILRSDGSEDVAVGGPERGSGEWEGGTLSKTALRWAAQMTRKGSRAYTAGATGR